MLAVLPDGRYEVKSFATDTARNNVAAYAVFDDTHTGPGGPVPPTGRHTSTDYVYVMPLPGRKAAALLVCLALAGAVPASAAQSPSLQYAAALTRTFDRLENDLPTIAAAAEDAAQRLVAGGRL
ncbi:MAG: hypothetical protein AB1505_33940, partial [Candidatus Latescibacterota bacterium]